MLLSTMFFLIVWSVLLPRFGKRRCFVIGVLMSFPSSFMTLFIPSDAPLWILQVNSAYSGISISSSFFIPWTMLPDVVDVEELRTGERREALFFSFFGIWVF